MIAIAGNDCKLLGLTGTAVTRDAVMSAFREKAKQHHPDAGGKPAAFRALVEARDRLLERAIDMRGVRP